MKVYMKITKDELGLPVAVANNVPELARLCKVHPDTIHSLLYKYRTRQPKMPTYIEVDIGEDDENEVRINA
jgi:hypothetical protein